MTPLDVAIAILHAVHVDRFQGSQHPQQQALAKMTAAEVWAACNDGQREFAMLAARVAWRMLRG